MISKLHTDKMLIKRVVSTTDEYGGTIEDYKIIAENVPCRLSQKVLRATTSNFINSSKNLYKIFTDLKTNVVQNDIIVLTRGADDTIYTFRAGKPISYGLIPHKEIEVEEVEENEIEGL